MTRINTNPDLDAIINEHNLRRDHAARQLQNWKGMAYENTQVTLVIEPGDIEAAIADSLSMPFSEFTLKFTIAEALDRPNILSSSPEKLNSSSAKLTANADDAKVRISTKISYRSPGDICNVSV